MLIEKGGDARGNTGYPKGAGGSYPAGDFKPAEAWAAVCRRDRQSFPVTAASISRHLSVLKDADLIRDTREGKYIYYELNTTVLEEVMLWIADLKGEDRHEENAGGT